MIKAFFISVGLKKLEGVRLYYLKGKNCLAKHKGLFQKVYKYPHFAHKYFSKSQNSNVNMLNLILLICAFSFHLFQINNEMSSA